jgi:hypothetical protein
MRAFPIILSLFLPLCALAAEQNAGIVQGLWYSSDEPIAGESVRIYVAIRNNTGSDLSGTVEFFDNDKRIDHKNIAALDGRIIESWADWTPAYGTHTVAANLSRVVLSHAGTSTQVSETVSSLAKDTMFVDRDTDGDGIGDVRDQDDDNDGTNDTAEAAAGTDPLVAEVKAEPQTTKQEPTRARTEKDAAPAQAGLERFFTPSPAEETLSLVTSAIGTMKESVDALREKRAATATGTNSSSVKALDAQNTTAAAAPLAPEKEGSTFLDTLLGGIRMVLARAADLSLFLASAALSHPALLEFAALVLILLLIFRFAARFGRRPRA